MSFEQGGGVDVIAQMDGGADLIDVLSAGALGADGGHLNLGEGDSYAGGYPKHGGLCQKRGAASRL